MIATLLYVSTCERHSELISLGDPYQGKTLFVVGVSIHWLSNRNWQTKVLDSWKVTQLDLPRQESGNVPATCWCIPGTDLLRQLCVLPHGDRRYTSNYLPQPQHTDTEQTSPSTDSSSSSAFPAFSLGFTILVRFLRMWPSFFPSNHRGSHIPSSWMMLCWVCFCCRHSPIKDMSVKIFWVRAMECMCSQARPRSILSSEGVLGTGVRTQVKFKGKIPFIGGSEEVRTRGTVSHRTASPTHYRLSYSGPSANPWTPVTWQGCRYCTHFEITGMTRPAEDEILRRR